MSDASAYEDSTTFIPEQDFAELTPLIDGGWTLRRGDRVLIRSGGGDPQAYGELTRLLTERFPGVAFTWINADEILVYRGDDVE